MRVVNNPTFEGGKLSSAASSSALEDLEQQRTENAARRPRRVAAVAGLFAVVAAAAFSAGFGLAGGFDANSGAPAPGSESPGPVTNADDTAAAVTLSLRAMVDANPGLLNLSASDVDAVVGIYASSPEQWDDAFIPREFVAQLAARRAEEQPAARRLGATPALADYRKLVDASQLAQDALSEIENSGFPDPILVTENNLDDRGSVIRRGSRCFIIFEGSGSAQDWISNLDLGSDNTLSVNQYDLRDDSCPCERSTLWWCSLRAVCPAFQKLGRGYDGFVKPWNQFRQPVWARMQTTCAGASETVFAGYSRGGGIAAVGAAALYREGLVQASELRLVTFGGPRVLEDEFSDAVHDRFVQERLVFRSDPVAAVPFDWMGYKHFGDHICEGCEAGRDRPFSINLLAFADHFGYPGWVF